MTEEGGNTIPPPPADTAVPFQGARPIRTKQNSLGSGHLMPLAEDHAVSPPEGSGRIRSTSLNNNNNNLTDNMNAQPYVPRRHRYQASAYPPPTDSVEMMGPILRRKKVVSMPLGTTDARRDEFFYGDRHGVQASIVPQAMYDGEYPPNEQAAKMRAKQRSEGVLQFREHPDSSSGAATPTRRQVTPPRSPRGTQRRTKNDSFMAGLLRRKQVSLDLLAPDAADFFGPPPQDEYESLIIPEAPDVGIDEEQAVDEAIVEQDDKKEEEEGVVEKVTEEVSKAKKKLFRPLIFTPPRRPAGPTKSGHGENPPHYPVYEHEPHPQHGVPIPEYLKQQSQMSQQLKASIHSMQESLLEDPQANADLLEQSRELMRLQQRMDGGTESFRMQVLGDVQEEEEGEEEFIEDGVVAVKDDGVVEAPEPADKEEEDEDKEVPSEEEEVFKKQDDDNIIHATRKDWKITGVLFVLMAALTGIIVGWETHLDESHSVFGVVGLACVTTCLGNVETKDFFFGDNTFGNGEVIQLTTTIDPLHGHHDINETFLLVEIVGVESRKVKWSKELGPAHEEERHLFTEKINTDGWEDASEEHVINSYSTSTPEIELSFTMIADTLSPLAQYSELIAALIMIFVYIFILLEVIHRTLVAVFGSMLALFFFFLMHEGHTESIATIMLHMEWSTLGLLFGMMLIVGELSHTGVFEWCSVRLLVASKGSFNRLVLLLCVLTAFSSAFLDNVTTMLLVAPVTIDMCNILGVDPRPYLIGEVLLSNVGGTATLIGDPPNIIIGSSYEEIGFVDFIINVAPCIIFFCVPATIALVIWIYKPYFSAEKMRTLDADKLKRTYPIYDEPRLMIAGTVTFFVILMFFLHPVHHKDTAWIALLGAFITMAFTNPHDVQDALRNHIEWDTLLFFAGLFVLVEVCAAMGLLSAIGNALASYISAQPESSQLPIAITLILWVSAITSAFLDNIPYTATMIPVVQILADDIDSLPLATLAWALSFGACLGGNGTLLGASANIVTAGISTNKGFDISFLNFLYPGMLTMVLTVAIANLYMLVVYVWI